MVRSLQITNFMIGLNKTVHVMSIWKNSLTPLEELFHWTLCVGLSVQRK